MALDGVILDIDGTWVLSNDAHAHAWVEAFASQIGVDVIALRCGGFRDEDLAGAIAIYNDPADLLDHTDGVAGLANRLSFVHSAIKIIASLGRLGIGSGGC